jgi:hypothetical protein
MPGAGANASERVNLLEMKNNDAIAALLDSIQPSIPQVPPTTQVEDVESTIIVHEPNKTIRFRLDKELEQKNKTNSPRRKVKRDHTKLRSKAKELIRAEWKSTNLWRRNERGRRNCGITEYHQLW